MCLNCTAKCKMNQIKIRAQFQSNYFHLKAFRTHLNVIKVVYSAQVHSMLYNKQWLLNCCGIVSDTLCTNMKTQSRLLWCEVYTVSGQDKVLRESRRHVWLLKVKPRRIKPDKLSPCRQRFLEILKTFREHFLIWCYFWQYKY